MRRRTSRELNELNRRVAEWRAREGGRGSRIPGHLWSEAVRVAGVVGVWATAKALHFNYEALRDRVRQAGGSERLAIAGGAEPAELATDAKHARVAENGERKGDAAASFVALEMRQVCNAGRTVIELVGRHGDRMRVDVAGGVDVVGLAQTLWSQKP